MNNEDKELWPALKFPPVNLKTVISAWWFYMPEEERNGLSIESR